MSTAFHPQTDGQTERLNRTLEEMLRVYSTYSQDQWDEYLPAVEFAYNNSKQASTNFTPFELDCGQPPNTPLTMTTNNQTNVKTADEFMEHWNNNIVMAKDALIAAQERQTKYANQHRQHTEYKIGDRVLLSMRNINTPIDKRRPTRKLIPKFIGPYTVIDIISPTAYKLELPSTLRIHPVFHVSLLKQYHETPENFIRPILPLSEYVPETGQEEFEVEMILDKQIIQRKPQYLVK